MNSSGVVVDHRVYNSFGLITSETNSAVNFAFGFDGMRWDAAAKLYFTASVPYDPASEERISRDPDGFASGTTNFYAWCGNDPVGEIDPSGECTRGGNHLAEHIHRHEQLDEQWRAQSQFRLCLQLHDRARPSGPCP